MAWTQRIWNNHLQDPFQSARVGKKIYSFRCTEDETGSFGDVEVSVFDTVTYSIYTLPLIKKGNEKQQKHTSISFVVAVSDMIYVFGPVTNETENVLDIYSFNTTTSEWTCIETIGGVAVHYFQCICVHENKIFVCVKTNKDYGNEEQQSLFVLDLSTNMWKCVSKNPWNKKCNAIFAYMRGNLLHILISRFCKSRGRIVVFDTVTEKLNWLDRAQGAPFPPIAKWLAFVYEDFLYVFADPYFYYDVEPQWKIYRYCMNDNWWDLITIKNTPHKVNFMDIIVLDSKVYFLSAEPSAIYVLDFAPSLATCCLKVVVRNNLDTSILPCTLQQEVKYFMW